MWADGLKVCPFYLNDLGQGLLFSDPLFYSQSYSGVPFNLGELNCTCQVCALSRSLPASTTLSPPLH